MKPGKTLSFITIGGSSFVVLAFFFGNWQGYQSAAQATPVPVPETKPENLTPVNQCLAALENRFKRCTTPYNVVYSIMQTETAVANNLNASNCVMVNEGPQEGVSKCFKNRETATDALQGLEIWGQYTPNFDGGCMQVNYKWWGKYFDKRADLFNPNDNINAGIKILKQRIEEAGGNIIEAAGRYHSKTTRHKNRYLKKFNKYYNKINNQCIEENL